MNTGCTTPQSPHRVLDTVLKKLNPTQQKQTTQEQNGKNTQKQT